MKKWMGLLLALCLLLSGCGSTGGVYVQSVEVLSNMGGIAPGDHFLGLVVSEHVTEIKKDSDKAVKELLVNRSVYRTDLWSASKNKPFAARIIMETDSRHRPCFRMQFPD